MTQGIPAELLSSLASRHSRGCISHTFPQTCPRCRVAQPLMAQPQGHLPQFATNVPSLTGGSAAHCTAAEARQQLSCVQAQHYLLAELPLVLSCVMSSEETPKERRQREREESKKEKEDKKKAEYEVKQATLAMTKIEPSISLLEVVLISRGCHLVLDLPQEA